MKKLFVGSCLSLLSLFATFECVGQSQFQRANQLIDHLFAPPLNKPKIYLLGVFHFAGEQVDSNTTEFKWRYITLEPRRQREIEIIRQKLLTIRPTVLCVEFPPQQQKELDSVYRAYCNGKLLPMRWYEPEGELVQLAFETGKRLGLLRITAVDAQAMAVLRDEKVYEEYEKIAPAEDSLFNYWDNFYYKKSAVEDSLRHHWTTLDFLRFINNSRSYDKMLGRWLITTRHGTNILPIGADQFITKYFNRNIRIYSNIQRAIKKDTDRVLVIYGNTHMSVLRQLFSASPMYEVVPPELFLK